MTSLLLLSAHPSHGIGLRRQKFDVIEVAEEESASGSHDTVDLAVVERAEPSEGERVVVALRQVRPQLPVVLLGPATPDWTALVERLGSAGPVRLCTPPFSMPELGALIRDLAPDVPHETAQVPAARIPEAETTVAVTAAPTTPEQPAATPTVPAPDTSGPVRWWRRRRPPDGPSPLEPNRGDWHRSLAHVSAAVGEVLSLTDLCMAIVEQCVRGSRAQSAALLASDGVRWEVVADIGLRPLERRMPLEGDHWLLDRLGRVGPLLLIRDTDVVRGELASVPLASRSSIVAMILDPPHALLLLGCADAECFDQSDLTELLKVRRLVTEPLQDALRLRDMAQDLSRFL